jgi:hypothetical protein
MSEHSKGHYDQQEFPAIPTSLGDSHEGELHRSSIDRSVSSEARMVANSQHDAVQIQDYESHEAMDTEGGGVALPIRQRSSQNETHSPQIPAIRQFDLPIRSHDAESEGYQEEVDNGGQQVTSREQQISCPEQHITDDLLGDAEPENEHTLAAGRADMLSEQHDDVSLAGDVRNYDLQDIHDNDEIGQDEVENEDEGMPMAGQSDAQGMLDADGPIDPAYSFFRPRNPARRWADDIDAEETTTPDAQISIDLFLQSRTGNSYREAQTNHDSYREPWTTTSGSYRETQTNHNSYRESWTTTSGSYREPQAMASQVTDSRPQAESSKKSTVDEEMVDREQTPSATNVPDPDRREFLAWKAKGRPDCSKCLKQHFKGTCRLSEWERELLNRDPEGYARYRKRMKKSRNRRFKHRESEQQSPPPQQPLPPLQRDQPFVQQNVPHTSRHANNPWLIQRGAEIIRNCPTSELEGMRHRLAAQPSGAILAQMVAAAQQERRVADIYSTEPQPSGNWGDTIPDRATTINTQAPDVAAAPDTSSTNGPSVKFRTGSELAYHRSLELGGPSAKAEGKQPKK